MPPPLPNPDLLARAVERLRAGGLVAFPTETVYGLGADALNPSAVELVFRTKGRPALNPLIVHVSDAAMARTLTARWPPITDRLAAQFWPGPLTLVLEKRSIVPDLVAAGGPTVALRCPDHPLALELIRRFGGPIVGPSANPSGRVSPTRAEHVAEAFTPEQVLILDGGPCRVGIESTVLSLARDDADHPRILRRGMLNESDLCLIASATTAPTYVGPAMSPGLLPQHYAPRTPAVRFTRDQWAELEARAARGGHVVALARPPTLILPSPSLVIAMPDDPAAYAAKLYSALHECDARVPDLIAIESPPADDPHWAAIHDRIRRATKLLA